MLYIEGYLWDAPKAKAACLKAIKDARKAGTKVAFTLSDPFLVGRYRDEFLKLLGDLDIIFANEDEAKALFEVESFDTVLQAARSSWHGIAALTRSEKGCVIAQGSEVHVVDASPVERVVDTTGAGDQFAAGFLYALTRGRGLAALRQARRALRRRSDLALRRAAGNLAQSAGDEGRTDLVRFSFVLAICSRRVNPSYAALRR